MIVDCDCVVFKRVCILSIKVSQNALIFSLYSLTSATHQPGATDLIDFSNNNVKDNNGWLLFVTTLGVFIVSCVFIMIIMYYRKGKIGYCLLVYKCI